MSFELTGCLLRIVSNFAADNSNQSHTYVGRMIAAGIFDQLRRIIEQVKPELRRVPYCGPQLLIHIFFIEAQLVEHTDKEPAW